MTPTDPLAPAGITWEMAMTNAGEILSSVDRPKKVSAKGIEWWTVHASLAQAWIGFARELTMHTRAGQSGPSGP